MFKFYILYSDSKRRYYIGHTEDFLTKKDAYRREFQVKAYKVGEAFKNLIK